MESYENLNNWRNVFLNTTGDTTNEIPILLIGNKIDKGSTINRDEIMRDWIKSNKARVYLETSALKYDNIENLFATVAEYSHEY